MSQQNRKRARRKRQNDRICQQIKRNNAKTSTIQHYMTKPDFDKAAKVVEDYYRKAYIENDYTTTILRLH
eukprot:2698112-Amphidinium_carterae.1